MQPEPKADYHIVIVDRDVEEGGVVVVVKRRGTSWRTLQNEFFGYKTSLEFSSLSDAAAWLGETYGWTQDRFRQAGIDLAAFERGPETILVL